MKKSDIPTITKIRNGSIKPFYISPETDDEYEVRFFIKQMICEIIQPHRKYYYKLKKKDNKITLSNKVLCIENIVVDNERITMALKVTYTFTHKHIEYECDFEEWTIKPSTGIPPCHLIRNGDIWSADGTYTCCDAFLWLNTNSATLNNFLNRCYNNYLNDLIVK